MGDVTGVLDVLIVDDNLDGCRPLARLLKAFGTRATCVGSGAEAIDYLRRATPRLLMLDVMMPGMDGIEVLRRIRADPSTARLPVVMFSASDDADHVARAKALGANDYWLKSGADFDRLRAMVETYLAAPG